MTVSSVVNRNDYIGVGSVSTYSYSFRIFQSSHVAITTLSSAGVQVVLVLNTDYTVTGVGDATGGSIVLTVPLPTGSLLTIQRVLPLTQTTVLRNQGSYFPESVEDALDRMVMIQQQMENLLDAALKLPTTETPSDIAVRIPTLANRISKIMGWDSLGNPTAVSVSSSGTLTASAYMTGLLLAASAQAAQLALALGSFDIIFLASKGPVCTTPDGTHTWRFGVDNSGNPITTQVT